MIKSKINSERSSRAKITTSETVYQSNTAELMEVKLRASSDTCLPDWPAGLSEPLAAKYIGVSQTTLRLLRKKGKVAKVAVTKRRFVYLRVELDRFLAKIAGDNYDVEVSEWETV